MERRFWLGLLRQRGGVPGRHSAGIESAGKSVAIGAEGQACLGIAARWAGKSQKLLAILRVPQLRHSVARNASQAFPIWTERYTRDIGRGSSFQCHDYIARLGIPYLHIFPRGRSKALAVRA